MTPEPRLSDRWSCDPNMSSLSPKKYRKNGSLANGEFDVRVTCSDEMFATPLTAWPAMPVKSGPPIAGVGAGADAAAGGRAGVDGGGRLGAGVGGRPHAPGQDQPPMKPATTSVRGIAMRFMADEISDCRIQIAD